MRVRFARTRDRTLGDGISLASALLLLWLLVTGIRPRRAGLETRRE